MFNKIYNYISLNTELNYNTITIFIWKKSSITSLDVDAKFLILEIKINLFRDFPRKSNILEKIYLLHNFSLNRALIYNTILILKNHPD